MIKRTVRTRAAAPPPPPAGGEKVRFVCPCGAGLRVPVTRVNGHGRCPVCVQRLLLTGKKDNIQLSLVGERTILAVIFDDRTTLGMVRLYSSQVSAKLGQVFNDILARKSEGEKISQEFGKAAQGKLDDIFGS